MKKEIILLQTIPKLGKIGEIVTVNAGFARNYLIPNKSAMLATEENKKIYEEKKAEIIKRNEDLKHQAENSMSKLPDHIVLIRQSGEDGKLFGSVNAKCVADKLREVSGLSIDKSSIHLHDLIKFIGIYKADVTLHAEVTKSIMINVSRSEDEAASAMASMSADVEQE